MVDPMKPDRKVAAGGIAGALSIILVWGVGYADIVVPPEVASAVTVIIGFAVSYLVPAKK